MRVEEKGGLGGSGEQIHFLGQITVRMWCRYIVLPQRPAGTEDWAEERLQQLVTRDSMIGVTAAKTVAQLAQDLLAEDAA